MLEDLPVRVFLGPFGENDKKELLRITPGSAAPIRFLVVAVRRSLEEGRTESDRRACTSKALDQWAYEKGVGLAFIRPGKPIENGFVESFKQPSATSPWARGWKLSSYVDRRDRESSVRLRCRVECCRLVRAEKPENGEVVSIYGAAVSYMGYD